jgi:long-subunit fatty acid transport protein
LGLTLKPASFINIGASFISPTWYAIDDSYAAEMATDWNNFLYEDAIDGDTLLNEIYEQTNLLISDYNLTTPWKFNGGVAFFIGKSGFITADVEYIDYSSTRLNSTMFSMRDDNAAIEQFASAVWNYRIGGEFRYNLMRFRAGYAHLSSGEESVESLEGGGDVFTGGFGVRLNEYYFDMALVHNRVNKLYSPYLIQNGTSPVADITGNNTKLMFTLGFNF